MAFIFKFCNLPNMTWVSEVAQNGGDNNWWLWQCLGRCLWVETVSFKLLLLALNFDTVQAQEQSILEDYATPPPQAPKSSGRTKGKHCQSLPNTHLTPTGISLHLVLMFLRPRYLMWVFSIFTSTSLLVPVCSQEIQHKIQLWRL